MGTVTLFSHLFYRIYVLINAQACTLCYLRYFTYVLRYLTSVGIYSSSFIVTAVEIFNLEEKNKCSLLYKWYLFHFRYTRQMSCTLLCHFKFEFFFFLD